MIYLIIVVSLIIFILFFYLAWGLFKFLDRRIKRDWTEEDYENWEEYKRHKYDN